MYAEISIFLRARLFDRIGRNFVERHSLRIVSDDSPKTMQQLCLFTKFYTKKLGEIRIFYAVIYKSLCEK